MCLEKIVCLLCFCVVQRQLLWISLQSLASSLIFVIVDLEINLYLQSKLRFIVIRDDGGAIGYRNHVRFNHDEPK
jgi:hypothetical protein